MRLTSTFATLLLLMSAASAQTGACKQGIALNKYGQPVAGATVRVCSQGATGTPCTPLVPGGLFSDAARTHALSNPFQADQFGNYSYCVLNGYYQEQVTAGTTTFTQNDVTIANPGNGSGINAQQIQSVPITAPITTGAVPRFNGFNIDWPTTWLYNSDGNWVFGTGTPGTDTLYHLQINFTQPNEGGIVIKNRNGDFFHVNDNGIGSIGTCINGVGTSPMFFSLESTQNFEQELRLELPCGGGYGSIWAKASNHAVYPNNLFLKADQHVYVQAGVGNGGADNNGTVGLRASGLIDFADRDTGTKYGQILGTQYAPNTGHWWIGASPGISTRLLFVNGDMEANTATYTATSCSVGGYWFHNLGGDSGFCYNTANNLPYIYAGTAQAFAFSSSANYSFFKLLFPSNSDIGGGGAGNNPTYVYADQQFISRVTTGTAPMQVSSTTQVANLNASLIQGLSFTTLTDSPGAITVNANTCTERTVAFATAKTTATVLISPQYALDANIGVSPGAIPTLNTNVKYRICNHTGGNITLNAAAAFNLTILQ